MRFKLDINLTDEQIRQIAFWNDYKDEEVNPHGVWVGETHADIALRTTIRRFLRLAMEEHLEAAKRHYAFYHPEPSDAEVAAIEAAARREGVRYMYPPTDEEMAAGHPDDYEDWS